MTDWGYRREPSPAMRKARKLSRLNLEEVSVVDRGAGVGCHIVLRKSMNHEEQSKMSVAERISKSFGLRASGQLSDFELGHLHQQRAAERGETLDQYYKSAEGQKALHDAVACSYFEKQASGSLGNGHGPLNEAQKAKYTSPKIRHAKPQGADDAGDHSDDEEETDGDMPTERDDGSSAGMRRDDNRAARRRPMTGANVNSEKRALNDVELTKIFRVELTKILRAQQRG